LADRVFRLMRMAQCEPADLSLFTAWLIGFSAPRTVPSAWDGAVPPVTMAGRHHRLDDYIAGNCWHRPHDEPVFVDLGCGFPPFTTVESAARLPGWQVIGVDPLFGRYLVYDDRGDYACVDDDGRMGYYRTATVDPDPTGTRARFRRLLPLLPGEDTGELQEVQRGGSRLMRHPLRGYEEPNLALRQGEIGSFSVETSVDVIRYMNVFLYFDRTFRQRALDWAVSLLRPGGLVLCGSNWTRSASSRYTVYQEDGGTLVAREFAFSIDNVRPLELVPWYALHDDDVENLSNAAAVATVRADEQFRGRFDDRLDALLAQRGFCPRGPDGYLGGPDEKMSGDECTQQCAELAARLEREGFVDDAVTVLRHAGQDAWHNIAGHVAMRPVKPR
jgi:SAM-dependent methyltransferase